MAKIRVLQSVASDEWSWQPGEVVELPAGEAAKWADGVRAESVPAGSTPRSTSTPERGADPVETPERPRRSRKS